jgi:energy-coupling factor transporter ATP-binding protein EcfA2
MDIGPGATDVAATRDRLANALRSYLIPRFEEPRAPLVVVFAGPTGSGKSTLINSLTGRDLSQTGSLRPTTTTPVVLVSKTNSGRFGAGMWTDCEVVAGSAPILSSMTLVDTPDIDSTSTEHRATAESLIDVADVVVFVTSALRYADDVAWQVLRRATSRGADVIHVLNRAVSSNSGAMVDLRSRLRLAGLDGQPLTIPEHHIARGSNRIPSLAIRSLRRRLAVVAADRELEGGSTRDRVLRVTLRQVAELLTEVTRLNEDVDALAAELSVTLADRAARLDLSGVGAAGATSPPSSAGWLARRRWRKASRLGAGGNGTLEQRLTGEISALIRGDLLEWIEEEGERLGPTGMDARPLSGSVSTIAKLDGDLETRIEIAYEQFGALVVELKRSDLGRLDETGVRSALGGVLAATALVDA